MTFPSLLIEVIAITTYLLLVGTMYYFVFTLAKNKPYFKQTKIGIIVIGLYILISSDEGWFFSFVVGYFWLIWSLFRESKKGKTHFFVGIAIVILNLFVLGFIDHHVNPSRFKIVPELPFLIGSLVPIPLFLLYSIVYYRLKIRKQKKKLD
jgi:hypothetical protein